MKRIILSLALLISYLPITSMEKIVEGTLIAGVADALEEIDTIKEAFSPKQDKAKADPNMQDGFAQFNVQDCQMQPYIAPDGIHIAIRDKHDKLHLYKIDKEHYLWTLPYSGWNVTWNRQGTQFYAERALGQELHYNKTVWDTQGKEVVNLGDRLVGGENFTYDGKYLLEKINDDSVTVIEISSGKKHKLGSYKNISLQDPQSEYIVSRSDDASQFYPIKKFGKLLSDQKVKIICGYLQAFSPDGSIIMIQQTDKKIALLDRAFKTLHMIQLAAPDSPLTQCAFNALATKLLINQKDQGAVYNVSAGSTDSTWKNNSITKGFISLDFSHSITANGEDLIFQSRNLDPKNKGTITLNLDSPLINLFYASPRHIIVDTSTKKLVIDNTNGDIVATGDFEAPPSPSSDPFERNKFFSSNGKYIWYNSNPERSLSVRQLPNIK